MLKFCKIEALKIGTIAKVINAFRNVEISTDVEISTTKVLRSQHLENYS
jgi:hypothetical protein